MYVHSYERSIRRYSAVEMLVIITSKVTMSRWVVGLASAGPSPSYRPEERGASAATDDSQLSGGAHPGGSTLQAQRRREGHPGGNVRPEVDRSREATLPAADHEAGGRDGRGRGSSSPPQSLGGGDSVCSTLVAMFLHWSSVAFSLSLFVCAVLLRSLFSVSLHLSFGCHLL